MSVERAGCGDGVVCRQLLHMMEGETSPAAPLATRSAFKMKSPVISTRDMGIPSLALRSKTKSRQAPRRASSGPLAGFASLEVEAPDKAPMEQPPLSINERAQLIEVCLLSSTNLLFHHRGSQRAALKVGLPALASRVLGQQYGEGGERLLPEGHEESLTVSFLHMLVNAVDTCSETQDVLGTVDTGHWLTLLLNRVDDLRVQAMVGVRE
jgi:hypothetical protein